MTYEVKLDSEGVPVDFAPNLIQAAKDLDVTPSTQSVKFGSMPYRYEKQMPCLRCAECGGVVFPENLSGRLAHLTLLHGYRMDGRRYDNQNQEVAD